MPDSSAEYLRNDIFGTISVSPRVVRLCGVSHLACWRVWFGVDFRCVIRATADHLVPSPRYFCPYLLWWWSLAFCPFLCPAFLLSSPFRRCVLLLAFCWLVRSCASCASIVSTRCCRVGVVRVSSTSPCRLSVVRVGWGVFVRQSTVTTLFDVVGVSFVVVGSTTSSRIVESSGLVLGLSSCSTTWWLVVSVVSTLLSSVAIFGGNCLVSVVGGGD